MLSLYSCSKQVQPLSEVISIRSTLAKADLHNMQLKNQKIYKSLKDRKVRHQLFKSVLISSLDLFFLSKEVIWVL